MALPVSIVDLLNRNRVESGRVEFKEGWNPVSIYHSICAFANDLDNLGGGYILVGVAEEGGRAVRPVKGLPEDSLDRIQQEMVGFNNLITPVYYPKISIETIDGKYIMAIWVPSGLNRPYQVPKDVITRKKVYVPYIRYGTSTIEAKGDMLDELNALADRTPFDERANPHLKPEDISLALLRDHLVKVHSRLAAEVGEVPITTLLEQMDLMTGPRECRMIKNVAAMMFCEDPEQFFPCSRVEIVTFPEGREVNPDNLIEVPCISGPVPKMIQRTLEYLKTHVIVENVDKLADKAEACRYFNFPYQAIEEAVVNALYHRDYGVREPVEITIEPDCISILSHSGPDRSITDEVLRAGKALRSRRYRNRHLGDFLKEIGLTEGRATGVPTIQKSLKENGSAPAVFSTNAERTFFLVDIPARVGTDAMRKLYAEHVRGVLETVISQLPTETRNALIKLIESSRTRELWVQALVITMTPLGRKSIGDSLGIRNRNRVGAEVIKPLMAMGLLRMSQPEKPHFPSQSYISDIGHHR